MEGGKKKKKRPSLPAVAAGTNGGRFVLLCARWAILLSCAGIVIVFWVKSAQKYLSGHTSVSTEKNETERFLYPSVTFCPKFKDSASLVEKLYRGKTDDEIAAMDLEAELDEISWTLTDFLKLFAHPEFGDPHTGAHVLRNLSYWRASVPHVQFSGRCFTYDPPFQSSPGYWYGIRFGLNLANTWGLSEDEKTGRLTEDMAVFVHERGKFMFYSQEDMPDSRRLDASWLRMRQANSVDLVYSRFTSLSNDIRPCSDQPGYSFPKCVDRHFARERGCHAPWHALPPEDDDDDDQLPVCSNASHILNWFSRSAVGTRNYERPFYSALETSKKTGCPLPCTSTKFEPRFSYEQRAWWSFYHDLDRDSDWVVHLWFKNFLFTYEREYVVCDVSCLLGEIGGNLGFFLGGSVLASIDVVFAPIINNVK